MTLNWAEFEGGSAGEWPLNSFLAERDQKAFYVTAKPHDKTQTLLLEMIPASNVKAEALRSSWAAAGKFSEAHLLRVHDAGESSLGGTPMAYVAVDLPDADASDLLTRNAGGAEEARRIGAAAAAALDFLHKRDLRHGSVTPPNIFFVGKEIKLSVDTIGRADYTGRETDLRQLGATLLQLATRTAEPDGEAAEAAARKLPLPLREVVLGCFESPGRDWTADRVARALGDYAPAILPISAPPPKTAARETVSRETTPKAPEAPPISPTAARRPGWLIPAACAALAILAFIGYRSMQTPGSSPGPEKTTATAPKSPSVSPPEKPSDPTPEKAVGRSGRVGPRSAWAVVAATYNNLSAAQRRAKSIEGSFPKFHVSVYPPIAGNPRYYVLLGSGLTQIEAEKLRHAAREQGAPRDSYATKLAPN